MLKTHLRLLMLMVLIFFCRLDSRAARLPVFDTTARVNIDTFHANMFAYKLEQQRLLEKRKLCLELSLDDLENSPSDYELRLWKMNTHEPSILYILNCSNSVWTLKHYQYFHRSDNFDESPPIIDSIVMETVKPQKMTWVNYIKQLSLDSIWTLKTESEIKGKSFKVLDGWIWLMEIKNKKQYKYFYYTVPEYYKKKDINHKKFVDFIKRLIDPIVYNGMINA